MEELKKFFTNTKMFYVATIENNQPRVRPFGNILFDENRLYINTGRKKRFYNQVMENPHVELCAFDKGGLVSCTSCCRRMQRCTNN